MVKTYCYAVVVSDLLQLNSYHRLSIICKHGAECKSDTCPDRHVSLQNEGFYTFLDSTAQIVNQCGNTDMIDSTIAAVKDCAGAPGGE